jgi:hypothetical protein
MFTFTQQAVTLEAEQQQGAEQENPDRKEYGRVPGESTGDYSCSKDNKKEENQNRLPEIVVVFHRLQWLGLKQKKSLLRFTGIVTGRFRFPQNLIS